jgi:hypothetical protein|tara:strand:+ start:1120 stop:1593 length:474 start_codon:yes stop_codon:yes gene_type:complete
MATDKAQRGFYLVTNTIKDELVNNPSIKTVTFGDITDIDLEKATMFPLAHIIVENVTHTEKTMQFSYTVLTMEQIDSSKEYVNDLFLGNSNTHDILNTQLSVSNRLVTRLRKGQLYEDGFQLVGDATCEPFFDRFENVLAGWATSFTLEIFNDLNYC